MRSLLATVGLSLAAASGALAATAPSLIGTPPGPSEPLRKRKPIPEYTPVSTVLLSEDLFRYEYRGAELLRALVKADAHVWLAVPGKLDEPAARRLLSEAGVDPVTQKSVTPVSLAHDNIWLRDYGPIPLLEDGPAGKTIRLARFRYDDGSARNESFSADVGARLATPVESLPVYVDGGNFLVAGDLCLTTGPLEGGGAELTPGVEALRATHAAALGCREVVVLQNPPHVHLDMWAKVVDDRTILVNDIGPATLAVADANGARAEALELKTRLDRMAAELSAHLRVVRVPMPLPYRGVFRTYTNAILVNGHAIVPSYHRFGWSYDDYPDAKLAAEYEEAVRKAFVSAGFAVQFVNADGMIFNGGAFHCVTIALPGVPSKEVRVTHAR